MTDSEHCPKGEDECPIYSELSSLKSEIEALSQQIQIDFLTGLFNRQCLMFSLEQEIERTHRSQQPTSLILIDIDHFKAVNDTHGHINGDTVLKHLSSLIKKSVRKIDIACRYGGEEFAVILPSTPTLTAIQVAERIRSSIENSSIPIDRYNTLKITISSGVATHSHPASSTPEALIARADKHLYEAKENGRNRVCHQVEQRTDKATVSSEEKDALFGSFYKEE